MQLRATLTMPPIQTTIISNVRCSIIHPAQRSIHPIPPNLLTCGTTVEHPSLTCYFVYPCHGDPGRPWMYFSRNRNTSSKYEILTVSKTLSDLLHGYFNVLIKFILSRQTSHLYFWHLPTLGYWNWWQWSANIGWGTWRPVGGGGGVTGGKESSLTICFGNFLVKSLYI